MACDQNMTFPLQKKRGVKTINRERRTEERKERVKRVTEVWKGHVGNTVEGINMRTNGAAVDRWTASWGCVGYELIVRIDGGEGAFSVNDWVMSWAT